MDEQQRQLTARRLAVIDAGLKALSECRAVNGDPAAIERELLQELDKIVFALGKDAVERNRQ